MDLKKLTYKSLPLESKGLPLIKEEDPKEYKPVLKKSPGVRVFDTSDAVDMKDYKNLIEKIYEKQAHLVARRVEFITGEGKWLILMEWLDLSYVL